MIIKQSSKIGRTSYKENQLGTTEELAQTKDMSRGQTGLSQAAGLQHPSHSLQDTDKPHDSKLC